MPNSLIRRFHQWSTARNILLLLLLFIVFNAIVLPPIITHFENLSHGAGLVDVLESYTPAELYAHLGRFEPSGRQLYILHELTLDVIYPLLSALLFSLLIASLLKRAGSGSSPIQWLALIPLVELAADMLENICLVTLLAVYPARLDWLAGAANRFTAAKWVLSYAELLALAGSLIGFAAVRVRRLVLANTVSEEHRL